MGYGLLTAVYVCMNCIENLTFSLSALFFLENQNRLKVVSIYITQTGIPKQGFPRASLSYFFRVSLQLTHLSRPSQNRIEQNRVEQSYAVAWLNQGRFQLGVQFSHLSISPQEEPHSAKQGETQHAHCVCADHVWWSTQETNNQFTMVPFLIPAL